jgi:serine/threonine-protein kinase
MMVAVKYFEEAVATDPRYAAAHAGIALALTELGDSGDIAPEEAYPRAKAAVMRALELDPDLADAHASLGYLLTVSEFDWAGAEQAFKRALALQPGHADALDHYGRLCQSVGRYDEAVALQRRACELDPLVHKSDVATALLRAGRYEEAIAWLEPLVERDPDYDRGHATLGWALYFQGRHDEAVAALQRAVTLSPEKPLWLAQLGEVLGLVGRTDEARVVLERLKAMSASRYVTPYHLAYVHTGLGEYDAAMDLLEQAATERSGAVYGIKGSFLFKPLREHPRFVALLRRMNIP